ncbi:hypothetical protein [Cryobacterium fucosi]|uniref:HNH endonuclease n=1 Tax=Cryobacterium fucosi TaxID=1259157 RepID=A0A4R9B4W4_9MICO|nr:hypothetical protein [Cryobacterium fucosi]TFD74721.1 hypothetical protein E3T48_12410 [Cryobacterium fucosi]
MGHESLNYRRGRGGRPFERLKKQVYATETVCRKCGRRVDLDLPYRDPDTGKVNRMSKSIGHTTELDAGGHPYDGHLEHNSCNSSAGARYGNAKHGHGSAPEPEVQCSADWENNDW